MTEPSKLDAIFKQDPFNLLESKQNKTIKAKGENDRLIESFAEISSFFELNDSEPQPNGILEFKLYARLKGLRESPRKIKILKSYDFYNLLETDKNSSIDALDLIKGDPLGILNDDFDESVYELKNVSKSERIRPEFLARRTQCKDFENYSELFESIHDDLENKFRKLVNIQSSDVKENEFYVLNGVVLFLEKLDVDQSEFSFTSGKRKRLEGRTRCIFDNGTESNMLFRSLVKALQLDGFSISQRSIPNEISEPNPDDRVNGYIYILRSLSDNIEIVEIENLYKIGFSTGDVSKRIRNAISEPTYLMAEVQNVATYRCYNINVRSLESQLHAIFNKVRLNIEIKDKNQNIHRPREWFSAPLDVIEETVELINNDTLNKYYYDSDIQVLIKKT